MTTKEVPSSVACVCDWILRRRSLNDSSHDDRFKRSVATILLTTAFLLSSRASTVFHSVKIKRGMKIEANQKTFCICVSFSDFDPNHRLTLLFRAQRELRSRFDPQGTPSSFPLPRGDLHGVRIPALRRGI